MKFYIIAVLTFTVFALAAGSYYTGLKKGYAIGYGRGMQTGAAAAVEMIGTYLRTNTNTGAIQRVFIEFPENQNP